jgi:maltose/moltooligosaccharide transporter
MNQNQDSFKPRMAPNSPDKLSVGRTFLIGFGFFTAMVAWSYFNFHIPLLLTKKPNPLVPPDILLFGVFGQNTILGFIMTLDNIIAILLQPYFGALSDRTASKFGRRTPYLLIGCTAGLILFTLIPVVAFTLQSLAAVIGVILAFNLAMAFYRAPIVALCPDLTSPKVRSSANAIINLMGGLGTVIAYVTPALLKNIPNEIVVQFGFISFWMLIGMIIVITTIKETPTGYGFFAIEKHAIEVDPITFTIVSNPEQENKVKSSIKDDLIIVFTEREKSALFMLFAIFSWFFGFNAIEVFYPLYAVRFLGWSEGQASLVLTLLPVSLILFAVPAGIISERIGRRKAIKIGLFVIIGVSFTIYFFRQMVIVAILLAIGGAAWGMVNINSITVIWQLAPEGKVGSYTGVYYTFSQLAAILSPVVMGFIVDLLGIVRNSPNDPANYAALFPYVLIWMLVALFFMSLVKRGEAVLDREKLQEYQNKYGSDD